MLVKHLACRLRTVMEALLEEAVLRDQARNAQCAEGSAIGQVVTGPVDRLRGRPCNRRPDSRRGIRTGGRALPLRFARVTGGPFDRLLGLGLAFCSHLSTSS